MSVFAIILSLALLMWGAYRGLSVLVLAPGLAALAVALSGDLPLLATYTQVFMVALGNFAVKYFPIFLLGSIFGRLMQDSSCASQVSKGLFRLLGSQRALLAIVLSCGLLTYGGVSAFVVVFTIYPLAAELFREASIPKRLIPGCIVLGAFTFSMTALPGTAQIHNLIPMSFFGTTAFAAPILGSVAGVLMFLFGMFWLQRRLATAKVHGEGFGSGPESSASSTKSDLLENRGSWIFALSPIVVVIFANYAIGKWWIPQWDTSYLDRVQFGSVALSSLIGTWSMILALLLGVFLLLVFQGIRLGWKSCSESLNAGALNSLLPTFNTASEVGYGATVAALAGFAWIRDGIFSIAPQNPLFAEVLSINVLSGITGSASGGLSIALGALGQKFLEMGHNVGVSPEVLHRVAALSSGGLDSLPHNGAVITILTVCGLSHRESYLDIFIVSLLIPLAVTILCVSLGLTMGAFA